MYTLLGLSIVSLFINLLHSKFSQAYWLPGRLHLPLHPHVTSHLILRKTCSYLMWDTISISRISISIMPRKYQQKRRDKMVISVNFLFWMRLMLSWSHLEYCSRLKCEYQYPSDEQHALVFALCFFRQRWRNLVRVPIQPFYYTWNTTIRCKTCLLEEKCLDITTIKLLTKIATDQHNSSCVGMITTKYCK